MGGYIISNLILVRVDGRLPVEQNASVKFFTFKGAMY